MLAIPLDEFLTHKTASSLAGVIFVAVVARAILKSLKNASGDLPLPPGPKRLPIVGNALDVPVLKPWLKFKEWEKTYGDIMYLNVLQQPMIVIGSADVAIELMEKRSNIYSDRPLSPMGELIGWDWPFSFQPYGSRWRRGRRCFHQYFNQTAVLNHRPIEAREVRALLRRTLEKPGDIDVDSIRLMAAAVVADVVYGLRLNNMNHQYIRLAQESIDGLDKARAPGAYWTEFLPFLKYAPAWMPGADARKLGQHYKPITDKMRNLAFDEVQAEMEKGSTGTSMAHTLIRKLQEQPDDAKFNVPGEISNDQVARDATAIAYFTAVDTALYTISTCLLGLAMNQDAQRKAQAQIESVVGRYRLPDFEDDLPYIKAIVMEGLRWIPVVPLGVPHRVTSDDHYRGYHIPKGAIIVPNAWGMLHDPKEYPNPEAFDPDRFMLNGRLNPAVRNPNTISFGFGRRICPGRHLASEMAFLTVASIVHLFDVLPAVDANGNPVDLTPDATTGLISYAERIPLRMVPRKMPAQHVVYDDQA